MKNLFGTTHRNPLRKLYDWGLTPVAEMVLGKERILELYLNVVEWGPGGIWGGARLVIGEVKRKSRRRDAARTGGSRRTSTNQSATVTPPSRNSRNVASPPSAVTGIDPPGTSTTS